jgi:adenine-specific DNA-methyltransferase
VIKYLGSKRLLVPALLELVGAFDDVSSVLDLFSGTSRVGHALKGEGYRVFSNDHNAYAATLARCYVQADLEDHGALATERLAALSALPPEPGWFTRTFCEESRFFQPHNGARVDAIRKGIADMKLGPEEQAVLLVSLMEAADRVDSTTGVQMAYLKQWAKRSHNDLELRLPALQSRAPSGKGMAMEMDALEAAQTVEADLTYLDPPYNQHKYLGNYHVWESLVRWDKPEVYGVACKRVDCRERRSAFNSRVGARDALQAVIDAVRSRYVLVSFSNEGFVSRPELEEMLSSKGEVAVLVLPYRRYVGARIGIYSPSGEKVGKVSHTENTEYVFVAGPSLPDAVLNFTRDSA